MALDPTTGTKPKLTTPTGPPHPALQAAGFSGSIQDFNERVEAATAAYKSAYGVKPKPGLMFDVVRSPLPKERFGSLFTIPQTKIQARSLKVAPAVPEPILTGGDVFKSALAAVREDRFDEFVDQYGTDLYKILQRNPALAAKFTKATTAARQRRNPSVLGANPGRTQTMGVVGGAGQVFSAGFRGFTQIAGALTVGPVVLGFTEFQAGKKSVQERSLRPLAEAQVEIGKAVATGVVEDVRHPVRNIGFLTLDILGGVGVVGKVGKVGAATAKGGVKAGAKELVTRRAPGTVEYRRGGLVEQELLSENAGVAYLQRWKESRQNAQMEARAAGTDTPGGLLSIVQPAKARAIIDNSLDPLRAVLGPEKKIGRLGLQRRRIEQALADIPRRNLEHAARAADAAMEINQRLPDKLKQGLSVGEQKAIQVLLTDDPTPVQTWRKFHESMIQAADDPLVKENHRAQLAALRLAEEVIRNPAPRPEFKKALDLTREVSVLQEAIKIRDLGLAPETAAGRVAAPGEVARTGKELTGDIKLEPMTDTAAYTPFTSRARTKKQAKDELRILAAVREGQYGVGPGQQMGELTHVFTGKSILAGDFRIDATNLVGEAYGRTVRAATRINEHKNLGKAATSRPRSIFDIPYRDIDHPKIPLRLKEIYNKIDDGDMLTAKEADGLSEGDLQDLIKFLYPGRYNRDTRRWSFDSGEDVAGIKWVDRRLVMGQNQAPAAANAAARAVQKAGRLINEPMVIATIYPRPAYAINLLSNAGMLLIQQEHRAVPNLARALFSRKLYGDRVTQQLDVLGGEGKNLSYVNRDLEMKALAGARSIAEVWHVLVDQWMRRAAVLYELKRQGANITPEGLSRFVGDDANAPKVVEAGRRAKKAMVEFDNLTEIEKQYLRNIIFVYPWVSRSAVWSIHTIVNHPFKSDILAQIGRDEMEHVDEYLKNAPSWFKRAGYAIVGMNADGTPKVINSQQFSAFSTLGNMASTFEALVVGGDPYANAGDTLGPGFQYLIYLGSGRDQYGNKLEGGDLVAAYKLLLQQLPFSQAQKRAAKTNPDLPAINIGDRETLIKREHAALKRMALSPGWWDGYGQLISGALTIRSADPEALAARWWRDQPVEERRKHELDLIHKVLRMQAQMLRTRVPVEVTAAVDTVREITAAEYEQGKELGRDLTEREKDTVMLDVLGGRLSEQDAARLRKQIAGLVTRREHDAWRSVVLRRYAGGQALQEWQDDVSAFASFHDRTVFQHKIDVLARRGIIRAKNLERVSQEQLDEYGRRYVQFKRDAAALEASGASPDQLRAFADENDVPVNGLPSPVRMAWANTTTAAQQQHLRSVTTRSWQSLSGFDKELLGRKVDRKLSAGWQKLNEIVQQQREALAREGRSFPKGYKRTLAQYVEKYFDAPGLVNDLDFSEQPLHERLRTLKPIAESPNREKWMQLLDVAAGYGRYLKSDGYDKTQVRQMWRDYVRDQLRPWVAQDPGFARELAGYGDSLLPSLLS